MTHETNLPPHNDEAEMALLGAILHNNRAYENVMEFVKPEHFANRVHGEIYAAVTKLFGEGKVADPITLKAHFERNQALQEIGGFSYLMTLAESLTSGSSAGDYGRLIYDLYIRRQLIAHAQQTIEIAYNPGPHDVAKQIEMAESGLFRLATLGEIQGGIVHIGEAAKRVVEASERALRSGLNLGGISTGLTELDKLIGGFRPGELIILAARPSMGKAQPLSAKVLCRDGWKPMGEIQVGDSLASLDGTPSFVTGVFPQGKKRIYKVTFSDGRKTECCEEHLWMVQSCRFNGNKVMSLKDLAALNGRAKYANRIAIPTFSGDFGSDEELPVDPWLLGFLLGDGALKRPGVALSIGDAEVIPRIESILGDKYQVKHAQKYDYRIIYGGTGNPLAKTLTDLGVRALSLDKRIPAQYLSADKQSRAALLQGLMDSDGWCEKTGCAVFGTSSEEMAKDFQSLVRSLGGICRSIRRKSRYKRADGSYVECHDHWRMTVRVPKDIALFSVQHKAARHKHYPFRAMFKSAEFVREEEAVCISVSHGSRTYVTDDFIVTHNTSLAVNMGVSAANPDRETGEIRTAVMFSLEMSDDQLAARILADHANVSSHKITRGMASVEEVTRLIESAPNVEKSRFFVDDTGSITVGTLRSRARRFKRLNKGLDMIIVDYLQLMRSDSKSDGNRVQEVSEITRGLKAIAKELEVPVIALSQLSRQVESREDKRPQLSDLRESGSIEQDADIVMFIYREEYYLSRSEPQEGTDKHDAWEQQMRAAAGRAEIIVAKNRTGSIGTAQVGFNASTTRFSDWQVTAPVYSSFR